jgi:hypothetical protein
MITSDPNEKPAVTPWEASTRSFKWLGAPELLLYPPQDKKLRMASTPTTRARMRFVKRQAPNKLKKEDLIAKWWIIAESLFGAHPPIGQPAATKGRRIESSKMRDCGSILYSQNLYGG